MPALGPALDALPDFGDIVGDQVRLPAGYGRVLRAIAVGRHHGGHAGGLAGLYVALVVAHVKAVLRLEAGFLGGVEQGGGMRLGMAGGVSAHGDGAGLLQAQVAYQGQR